MIQRRTFLQPVKHHTPNKFKTINRISKVVVIGIITAEIKKYDQTKNNFPDI